MTECGAAPTPAHDARLVPPRTSLAFMPLAEPRARCLPNEAASDAPIARPGSLRAGARKHGLLGQPTPVTHGAVYARAMIDHSDVVLATILDELRHAGYVEMYTDGDGKEAMRLTPEGEKVARQLAILGEDGQAALMDALMEETGDS